MHIKKITWLKKYIKLLIADPNYSNIYTKLKINSLSRAVIIGMPVHSNLGDHLIAEECLNFVNELGYSEVIEIPEFVYELFPQKIFLTATDTIFIVGGGWMGDLYEDEDVIEEILTRWKRNKIVILPQTIYFSKKDDRVKMRLKKVIKETANLCICARERNSYDLFVKELGVEKCYLLPDMALLPMNNIEEKIRSHNKLVIFSMRDDAERNESHISIETIRNYLVREGYQCLDSSTVIRQKIVRKKSRTATIYKKIDEYSHADLIITDRLHSMVFALLAGTKCIALDNLTHKVSGVYNAWLENTPGLLLIDTMEKLNIETLCNMLASNCFPKQKDFSKQFSKFIEEIKGINETSLEN